MNKKLKIKFVGKCKGSKRARTILTKNEVGGFLLPDLKTNCTVTSVKSGRILSSINVGIVWLKDKHIDQWNRIESLE